MSSADWKGIAGRLNAHLSRARLSSQAVARKAGVDRKTIDRLRAGQSVRPQTLHWVEQALRIELREPASENPGAAAPAAFGGYHRNAVAAYIGDYLGFRRSFDTPGDLIASSLSISWTGEPPALRFAEDQHNRSHSGKAYDYHFGGDVLIPPNLGVMHFVVRSSDGRVRLISTSMPREDEGRLLMKGFILTLNEVRDIGYYPATSPIFLARSDGRSDDTPGVVRPGDERYLWADGILRDIERRFSPLRNAGE